MLISPGSRRPRVVAELSFTPGALKRSYPKKVLNMAAVCDVCGKKPSFGKSVSHSHVRTNRRWSPNIQRVRAIVNGSPRRVHVCTGCLKSNKIVKA